MSLLYPPCLFFFSKNPHQTSGMATKPAAKHQRSDKFLKIKYKPLRELNNNTHFISGVPKNTLSTWKKGKKSSI